MFEKLLVVYQNLSDPPKSPLKRGTSDPVPPFLRGARGDQPALIATAVDFSNILLVKYQTQKPAPPAQQGAQGFGFDIYSRTQLV